MSRDGNGNYSLPAGNPVVTATTISSTVQNNTMNDVAAALTASIASDGQTTPSADLKMGGFKHKNVGNATSRISTNANYASAADVQDGSITHLTGPAGTNTITASAPLGLAAYAAGQGFNFTPAATNTGATTLNVNSIGAKNIFVNGAACVGGELVISQPVELLYDGTQFNVIGGRPFIDQLTALTAPAIDDELAIFDLSAKTINKITASDVLKIINGLTADATPDQDADYVTTYDASASGPKKVLVKDLKRMSQITASLGADVALNNTANYFDGPSIAQGSSGTWFVSGTVTINDTAGAAAFSAKLWDGTTVIASGRSDTNAINSVTSITLSGYLASPAANLRISVKDASSTSGKILFNVSGNSKDATISAIRIA